VLDYRINKPPNCLGILVWIKMTSKRFEAAAEVS
jgi:hypothetical protein